MLCASPQYLITNGTPECPKDLREHRCIHYSYPRWQKWYLMAKKRTKLNINNTLSVNSVNGQKQLTDGSLIHVMPTYVLSPYEELSSTYAIYLKREIVPVKVRVFLVFLGENITELDI
jgi:DNA-binding transcriptional LysR family regulator